uniref:Uncharacterized protein n=1 Tax=Zea mays TaxID=4577 RepID=C0P9A1_MAIZE|nr:unknown [Zea mays]
MQGGLQSGSRTRPNNLCRPLFGNLVRPFLPSDSFVRGAPSSSWCHMARPCSSGPSKRGFFSKLLRGMCSNGPDVGIVPHKSLLETSTTLRLDIPESSLGIGPVK